MLERRGGQAPEEALCIPIVHSLSQARAAGGGRDRGIALKPGCAAFWQEGRAHLLAGLGGWAGGCSPAFSWWQLQQKLGVANPPCFR